MRLKNCLFGATSILKYKAILFGVDNSSSYNANNHKNSFLVLVESPSYGINQKRFNINFSKVSTNFCLSLHYNCDNSYFFFNGMEIFHFIANNKNVNFPIQFSLGRISNGFGATDFQEVSFKRKSV